MARVSPACSQGHQGVNPRPLGTAQDMLCGAQHLRCAHEDKLEEQQGLGSHPKVDDTSPGVFLWGRDVGVVEERKEEVRTVSLAAMFFP